MAMSQTDVCVPRTVIDNSRFDLEIVFLFPKSCRISSDTVANSNNKRLEYAIHLNYVEISF